MAKTGDIIETKIDRWDGGVVNDPRSTRENTCRLVMNFDIFTNPTKLTPYRQSVDGLTTAGATPNIEKFILARVTGATWGLYGLGAASGAATRAGIYYKNLTTGGANDLDDSGWVVPSIEQGAGTGTTSRDLFAYYHRTGKLYGARNNSHIWSVDTVAQTFNDSEVAVSYTNIAQGLVHSKDNILYIPYDNKIARNENGTWELEALVLPDHFRITSICEYGNKIAVAMAPLSGESTGQSRVYIWNRDISVTTLDESIPWENGRINAVEVVDGFLLGLSISGDDTTRFNNKIIVRYLTGSEVEGFRAEKLFEIQSVRAQDTELGVSKQMVDGRLHFFMSAYINGSQRTGVWSIGRVGDQFSLNMERSYNNEAVWTSSDTYYDFFYVGDYLFQAFNDSGYAIAKTDSTEDYTNPAIYESKYFNAGDSSLMKDLEGISMTFEPLFETSSPVVRLFYRIVRLRYSTTGWIRIWSKTITSSADDYYEKQVISTTKTEDGTDGSADTITVTIASPAVVTLTNHDLVARQPITFTTTGALPTGITADTTYYVITTGLTANTFQFSATVGGSAVNTSGSQSGTHSLHRATELPKEYNEIEFMIEAESAAAGARPIEITSLSFRERITGKRPY